MEGGGESTSQLAMDYLLGLLQECQSYIINHLEMQLEETKIDLRMTFSALHEKIERKEKLFAQILNKQSSEQPLSSERGEEFVRSGEAEPERKKKKTPFLQRMTKKDKRGGKGECILRLCRKERR